GPGAARGGALVGAAAGAGTAPIFVPPVLANLSAMKLLTSANGARRLAVLAVVLATLLGGTLRFYGLGTPGLWLDEMLMYDVATQSKAQPWYAWLTGFEFENGPLYLGSLLAGRVVPGVHGLETSDRLAAAVAGTLTIP